MTQNAHEIVEIKYRVWLYVFDSSGSTILLSVVQDENINNNLFEWLIAEFPIYQYFM